MNMNEENHNKSPFSYAKRTDTAELRAQFDRAYNVALLAEVA